MAEVDTRPELSSKAQAIAKIITAAHDVGKMLETPGVCNHRRTELMYQLGDQRREIARLTRHTLAEVENFLMGECEAMAHDLERRFGIVAGVHIPQ